MGVCFECRVTIDGRPGQRACLTTVAPGMTVETRGSALARGDPCNLDRADAQEACSLLIVGAGPAGLCAAEAAAREGLDVVVLDERPSPGGQYFKPLASSHRFAGGRRPDAQYRGGEDLLKRVQALGVRILSRTLVWDAEPAESGHVIVRSLVDERVVIWTARRLVIATGAFERAWPVPGWTLPGVMATGAAQTLSRAYQVAPGSRVLVAGNGPLNLQVAADLAAAGVHVVAVAEAAAPGGRAGAGDILAMLRTRPDLVWNGARYLAQLARRGVPVLRGHVLTRVDGTASAERATLARIGADGEQLPGTEMSFDIDAVCLGYGLSPSSELSRLLGCRQVVDAAGGNVLVPERDADGRTSVSGVFVAGDAAGPLGAHCAMAQGALAGIAAAADLRDDLSIRVRGAPHRRALRREKKFQRALWRVFSTPLPVPPMPAPDVLLCRCESVPVAAVRAAIAGGAADIPAIKRATRCGMGRCQGRYCTPLLASLLGAASAEPISPTIFMRGQAPVRPVPMSSIALRQETAPNPGPGEAVDGGAPPETLPDVELGHPDVLVIGAGGVGLFTAMALAEAGREVVVLDKRTPYSEASGANAGSLHVQFQSFGFPDLSGEVARRAASTLRMQVEATYLWKAFSEAQGADIEVEIEGGLTVADDDASLDHLRKKVEIERAAGLDMTLISGEEARAMLPLLSSKVMAASFSPDEGKINPMRAATAVLQAVRAAGVRIEPHTTVWRIEASGNSFAVMTDRGIYRPGKIVNAAGAWSGAIAQLVGDSLPIRQNPIQMLVSEATGERIPYHLAHARRRITLKQAVAGNLVIGGGWRARINPVLGAARPTREALGANIAVTLELLPGFSGLQIIRSWTGMAFTTPPTISPSPSTSNLFHVATQNAMTLAPVLGRAAAALVLGQAPEHDMRPFALRNLN
jgi:glycine/D-amino acid oxidase-like deaminating enzyme